MTAHVHKFNKQDKFLITFGKDIYSNGAYWYLLTKIDMVVLYI
jgi:hypothetical protein